MNREILFRGQRCSDGEWVYGFYVESKYSWRGHKPHRSWIIPNAISNGGFFNILGRYAVKDDTVGQFTGMCDKNGVKIFAGDVLDVIVFDCFDNDKQYRVRVEWVGTEFMGVDVTNDDYAWNLFWLCNQDEEIEVIGNIYDNPELLSTK